MATLTEPTGADIVGLFTGATGSNPAIGAYDADAIDADTTANGDSAIVVQELLKMNAELDASGLDSNNLTSEQENAAWLALLWACVFQYQVKDRIRALAKGDKCIEEGDYNALMKNIASTICNALASINARSKYYCGYYPNSTASEIKNGNLVNHYASTNYISTIEN